MCAKRISAALTLLVCLLAFPPAVWGWGDDAHRVVAQIAEERLSTSARRAVRQLIGNQSLADVSTWADAIRAHRPETKSWHFVDIPVTAEIFDRARDCHNGDCIIDQIEKFSAQVSNQALSKDQRAEALKFLVHFAADLHQPLHCATRSDSHGRDDRGGNERTVRFMGKLTNLHKAWDVQLVQEMLKGQDPAAYAKTLNRRITAEQAVPWSRGNAESWANESHKAAIEHAYKDVPADGPPPHLEQDYLNQAKPAAEQQLMKAGVRLATLLNQAFP